MQNYTQISLKLKKIAKQSVPPKGIYFKTGPGGYAEKDRFLGVSNPILRKLSKEYRHLPLTEIRYLIKSQYNEERMLALFILVLQYQKAPKATQQKIVQFYLQHLAYVNNWNLVDASAHLLLGCHLLNNVNQNSHQNANRQASQPASLHANQNITFKNKKNMDILIHLSKSKVIWERRVAMVSTWYFIREGVHEWTYKIARILLKDKEDLIHKAVGWMLRESGKKNLTELMAFLDEYANIMPRTMLRYAIEKFPERRRQSYLALK